MRADIWGPHAWIFLHSISLEYPDNPTNIDKNNMKNFIDYEKDNNNKLLTGYSIVVTIIVLLLIYFLYRNNR